MIKKLIINLFIIAVALVVLDYTIGAVLRHYYFTESSGLHYRTTYSMDKTTAEILIFGSSRANHHYVPEVFEDSLKMSFYNTGRDGNSILYNYAVYLGVVKRYNPKIIILDINPDDIFYSAEGYDRLSSLLPYYKDHPEIHPIVELRSPYEKVKLLSSIYPYNSLLLTIWIGNLEMNKKRKGDIQGYIPLYNHLKDTPFTPLESPVSHIDPNKVKALAAIAESCKQRNIGFLMVQSPMYAITYKTKTFMVLDSLARKLDFGFWDYANDTLFINHPDLFQDRGHLNHDGAVLFSRILAGRIAVQSRDPQNAKAKTTGIPVKR